MTIVIVNSIKNRILRMEGYGFTLLHCFIVTLLNCFTK
jgi:hypothetical protein